ncbi:Helicase associated domain protein [Streptomyces decoyicus]
MDLWLDQREAVDAVVRALTPAPGTPLPAEGLRTQVHMATGTGKTLVAERSADELHADRTLVLMPSLDLVTQTAVAWHTAGRRGPVFGLSSLKDAEVGFSNTTDPLELAHWCNRAKKVTVFATYASLGLGTLERAHQNGLAPWDLIVVDEAHRVSGRMGKPWAVVHHNDRIPAARRLYMTATPRMWELNEDTDEQGEGGRRAPGTLVASMEDDPEGVFGSVCFSLSLSSAIAKGIIAPYRVICVDITDPEYQSAVLTRADSRSDAVRGSRLAALQSALVKTAAEKDLIRTLTFHHLTAEAEAFATGLPDVAAQLYPTKPEVYPRVIGASWLYGDHKPAYRRQKLAEFAKGVLEDGTVAEKMFMSSAKVLGEGVDTRRCDSVFWADVHGSMPDLVQAVGRALRMQPGEGKVASLVVPVLFGPGEGPDDMLTSKAYDDLSKLLEALRAHDARVVEALAEPQAPSRYQPVEPHEQEGTSEGGGPDETPVRRQAQDLLEFSTPRDAALLATFISLRVLDPEDAYWKRGMEAALAYQRLNGDLRVPFAFKIPKDSEDWPAAVAGFPLGQWIADARRAYGKDKLAPKRFEQLHALGMIWAYFDVAFDEGLTAARGWADEHNVGLAAPVDASWNGYPVGTWLKNQRAAARRADDNARCREEDLPVEHPTGALSEERREALEDIDPHWYPAWPVAWQRAYRLVHLHRTATGALPTKPGEAIAMGEDLGRWIQAQARDFERLSPAQQWLVENVLELQPTAEQDKPPRRRSQQEKWNLNLAAAAQYRQREGNLAVPRSHTETWVDEDGQEQSVKLGSFVANAKSRAAKLAPERRDELSTLGMRWN